MPEDAIARIRQIIADHCFGPHDTKAAYERALEIASACTDDMVDEDLLAATATATLDFDALGTACCAFVDAHRDPIADATILGSLAQRVAVLAAADAGWCLMYGDERADPAYIRFLAKQLDAFEDHASPAAPATINVTVDREANAAYVRVAEGVVFRTAEINSSVNADYDRTAQLLGVEILDLPLVPAAPADDEATLARVRSALSRQAMFNGPATTREERNRRLDVLARAALAALREGQQK